MSSYHKPTYSAMTENYNPSSIRLYGLPNRFTGTDGSNVSRFIRDESQNDGLMDAHVLSSTVLKVNDNNVVIATYKENGKLDSDDYQASPSEFTFGVIFGYAYEGHCYDLPRPKIMLIPATPEGLTAGDCGYGEKEEYKVWIVDKLDRCIEIEITDGFVEKMVLEANMPGNRSPSTYHHTMQFASGGSKFHE